MAQQTDAMTDAPIHKDVIESVARRYEVDATALAEYLTDANNEWQGFLPLLREHHDVVEETDERLIVLDKSGHETREMDKHLIHEHDIDIPDEYGSRANLIRRCHDRHAKQVAWDAFGSEQEAIDAVGYADAVIVNKD